MTLETNEQILHQMNINLELLEVSDCRLTQTLSVTSTTKTSCIKTVLDNIHGSDLHGLQAMTIYM
jgi:hypothetical protein